MKPDEIKLRVSNYVNTLIDDIFSSDDFFGRLKSATAKFWVEQNLWKLDSILCQFKDAKGNIDIIAAEKIYSETIFDENGNLSINLKKLISNESINRFLPDSTVLFTRDDLHSIFSNNEQATINNIVNQ